MMRLANFNDEIRPFFLPAAIGCEHVWGTRFWRLAGCHRRDPHMVQQCSKCEVLRNARNMTERRRKAAASWKRKEAKRKRLGLPKCELPWLAKISTVIQPKKEIEK
jgi:hypothetical protein